MADILHNQYTRSFPDLLNQTNAA